MDSNGINSNDISKKTDFADPAFEEETALLRFRLKQYFYTAVKYHDHSCSIHVIRLVFMFLQIVRVVLITSQMLNFGNDRAEFNTVARLGHRTLRHLLLKDWDASWETPPYPLAHGEFAVYDIESLKDNINYAVTKLYNIREEAIGFFDRHSTHNITAEVTSFNFSAFEDANITDGLNIHTVLFKLTADEVKDPSTNVSRYVFDVHKFLKNEKYNLSNPLQRLLSFKIGFSMRSVRVDVATKKARCLNVDGNIVGSDIDNNGQVKLDLQTRTSRRKCMEFGYNIMDVDLKGVNTALSVFVLMFVFISLLYTTASITFGVVVCKQTKSYMKRFYRRFYEPEDENEVDLPTREYMKFFKGWDLIDVVADIMTIAGTLGVAFQLKDQAWTVASLETYAVVLGIGCILSWVGLMRYLKFNYKFNLLFSTICYSVWDVMAYLICISLLFVGYMCFGYVVIGPYHVKYQTIKSTATTLFSLINGDEIYATFALFEEYLTGGPLVPVFYQIYLGSYIAIFTVIVINLLIALFTNAYEAMKMQYENPDEKDDGPMEKALKQVLTTSEDLQQNAQYMALKSAIVKIMDNKTNNRLSFVEDRFRSELRRTFHISPTTNTVVAKKPKTLRAFIADDNDSENDKTYSRTCCCRLSCLGFRK